MRKAILFIVIMTGTFGNAQKIDLDQLEVPTTPAITILDAGETNIESLTTTNAFSINNFNINNNALEVTPYWLKKDRIIKGYEFYGLKTTKNYGLRQNVFDGIKKFSVSVAFVNSDSVNNYSVGLRVNLLKIRNKRNLEIINSKRDVIDSIVKNDIDSHNEAVKQVLQKYREEISKKKINLGDIIFKPDNELTGLELEIKKEYESLKAQIYATKYDAAVDSYIKSLEAAIHTKPLLQLDFGGAYSFYNSNQFSEIQTGRYGIWTNISSNLYHKNQFGVELSIHTRYLKDKLTILNEEQDIVDFGGKLSLKLYENLTFSYEYIRRVKGLNDLRSVGEIKYRLFSDKNIYLSGGFGRNFMTTGNNTVSLLGIKWGIANEKQKEGAEFQL